MKEFLSYIVLLLLATLICHAIPTPVHVHTCPDELVGSTCYQNVTIPSDEFDCSFISHEILHEALSTAVCGQSEGCDSGTPGEGNGGMNTNMWATVVNKYGRVCAVTYSGPTLFDQWIGSRAISAEKASTALLFCLPGYAISTANLFQPSQPGQFMFGLEVTHPAYPEVVYGGATSYYGMSCDSSTPDPMCNKKPGGTVVFGGGLGLYNSVGELVGGLGVSGDTSCADHNIAWKTRSFLNLNFVPAGPGKTKEEDNILYPETKEFGHPVCSSTSTKVAKDLHKKFPNKKPTTK